MNLKYQLSAKIIQGFSWTKVIESTKEGIIFDEFVEVVVCNYFL